MDKVYDQTVANINGQWKQKNGCSVSLLVRKIQIKQGSTLYPSDEKKYSLIANRNINNMEFIHC